MSNKTDLLVYVSNLDEIGALEALVKLGVKASPGYDEPDANGNVALTGLPEGSVYRTVRFAINEILPLLSPGKAHDTLAANLKAAQARYNTGMFIAECQGAGTPPRWLDGVNIPNTRALPDNYRGTPFLGTVAQATVFYTNLSNPVTGDDFPHP